MVKMSEVRLKKYLRKINHSEKRINQVNQWISEVDEETFKKDEMRKLAVYKAFQEAIEAIMDVVAMMCKDIGVPPEDDYTNVETLIDKKVLPENIGRKIIEANRLRNHLVHRYNKISDEAIYELIIEYIDWLTKSLEVVKSWLNIP